MKGIPLEVEAVTPMSISNYDIKGCVDALRCANVTPHVAQNTSHRSSAIDGMRNLGMAVCRWPSSKGLVCLETGESDQIGQFPARG